MPFLRGPRVAGVFLFCLALVFSFRNQLALVLFEQGARRLFPGAGLRIERVYLGWQQAALYGVQGTFKSSGVPVLARGMRLIVSFDWLAFGRGVIRRADFSADMIETAGWKARQVTVGAEKIPGARDIRARFYTRSVSQGEKMVQDIRGVFMIDVQTIASSSLEARLAGGTAAASVLIRYKEKGSPFSADVAFKDIRLKDIIKAVEAQKKIEADGVFSGPVKIVVRWGKLQHLEGQLVSTTGGRFSVKDTSLIDPSLLKEKTVNIVIENLKDYHYDIGKVFVGQEGGDIKLRLLLEGSGGQRDVDLYWHRR